MSTEHAGQGPVLSEELGLAAQRAEFEAWLDRPVAAGDDPAPWIDGLAAEAAWQAWKYRGAEIERLTRLTRAAIAFMRGVHPEMPAQFDNVRSDWDRLHPDRRMGPNAI